MEWYESSVDLLEQSLIIWEINSGTWGLYTTAENSLNL